MLRPRTSTQPSSMMRSPSLGFSPVVSVSRTICLRRYPPVGELVGPLVFRVPGMALHPVPLDCMRFGELVETPPQVDVLHGFTLGGEPAAPLPAMDPLRDALLHVLRVGVQAHPARALERLERADHRRELHAVVGGVGLAPPQLLFRAARAQQHAPAAGAGIAAAGAVAEDLHRILLSHSSCATSAGWGRARGAVRAPGATWG